MKKFEIIKKDCWICGKEFNVKIRLSNGKIITKCFHNHLKKRYFTAWGYGIDSFYDALLPWYKRIFKKERVWFDPEYPKIWRILGCCKLTRWLIYNTYGKWIQREKVEYWECVECANRKDD
jgi:hypothetical protein